MATQHNSLSDPQGSVEPLGGPRVDSGGALVPRSQSIPIVPEDDSGDRMVSSVLNSFRRRWPIGIAIGTLLAVLAGAFVWQMQNDVFRASALIHIASEDTPLVFTTVDRTGRNPYEVFKSTQQQMITTRFVLNNALSNPDVAALPAVQSQVDPVKWLADQLRISFPGEAEIMEVSLTGGDPKMLALLVNNVVDSYLQEVVLADRNRRLDRLADLEKQQGMQEDKIRKSGESIAKLVEALGTSSEDQMTIAQQGVIADLNLIRGQLTKVRLARIAAKAELDLLQARFQANAPDLPIHKVAKPLLPDEEELDENQKAPLKPSDGEQQPGEDSNPELPFGHDLYRVLATDPEASALLSEIDRLDSQIALIQLRFNEEAAKESLPEITTELASLRDKLDIRKAELQKELKLRLGNDSIEERIELLSLQVVLANEQEAELVRSLEALETEVRTFGRKSIVLEMERAKLVAHKRISERLTDEILQLQVEINSDPRIRSLSKAVEPKSFEHKSKLPKVMAASLACFLFPICGLIWLDLQKKRIGCAEDLDQRLGVTLLGAIPPTPRIGAIYQPSRTRWQAKLNDSLSSIAAMLLRKQRFNGLKTIVVTSAVSGEGKTTLAGNLGITLTSGGSRVLVIDFDVRRPSLGRVFGLGNELGVCEVLRGEATWQDSIQKTEFDGLSLLTTGNWHGHVLEELSAERIERLISEFRNNYDFVVIDTSPVLPVVDARLLAQHADGVLLSLMRDVSRLPQVESACDILHSYGAPILGAVLTGVETESYQPKISSWIS